MSTSKERFTVILTGQFKHLFTTPAYAIAAAKTTPEAMAEKFVSGLIDGSAANDGVAVKSTCKALGIKPTYKAIREYLNRAD